jgi:fatty acid-binding protein DegV
VPQVAEELERQLRAEYGEHVEILTAPVTPVIATHTGIGTVGIAFLVED